MRKHEPSREELLEEIAGLKRRVAELEGIVTKKSPQGVLPICALCKKVSDDKGAWVYPEAYIRDYVDVELSHGMCSECTKKFFPDYPFERK